jgi:hypothetical protein
MGGTDPASVRVWEVIPVKQSKAYRAISVKQVNVEKILSHHLHQPLEAGLDIGKQCIWTSIRFRDGTYLRPWRAQNPREVGLLSDLLKRIAQQAKLTVAMESSGTYGDALRHSLAGAALNVHRVSSKASHDWSEVFDGVPSQHDGKDAAVVAELCAMGKSVPWPLERISELEEELRYWVDQLDAAHRVQQVWIGRLESRLVRHWPEVCDLMKLSSPTLLKALKRWAGPAALAADPQAATTLRRFSHRMLDDQTIDRLINEARQTMGVPMGRWEQRRLREDAQAALAAHRQKKEATRRLKQLSAKRAVGEPGRSSPLRQRRRLPQGDGTQSGRAIQRHVSGRAAHQQTRQVAAQAFPVLCSAALCLKGAGPPVVSPQEAARPAARPARHRGHHAQAAADAVDGGPGRVVRSPAALQECGQ